MKQVLHHPMVNIEEVNKLVLILLSVCCAVSSVMAQERDSRMVSRANDRVVDCLQYLPMAFPEIMKICGGPTRSDWGRLVVSQSFSVVLTGGSVYALKRLVGSERPDRSDDRSFPSGHSAWAFAGATVVARELGWRSPWYSVGAYAFATGIAIERIAVRRHSAVDVTAGALIGVAMTEAGYFLADRVFGTRGLGESYRLSIQPTALVASGGQEPWHKGRSLLSPGLIVSLEF